MICRKKVFLGIIAFVGAVSVYAKSSKNIPYSLKNSSNKTIKVKMIFSYKGRKSSVEHKHLRRAATASFSVEPSKQLTEIIIYSANRTQRNEKQLFAKAITGNKQHFIYDGKGKGIKSKGEK